LEYYSQAPSWEEASCLRLNYFGDLKTRSNCGSWNQWTPCHSVLVEDSHKRWLWREGGSDVDLLRTLSSRELGQWQEWWLWPCHLCWGASPIAWGLQWKRLWAHAGELPCLWELPPGFRRFATRQDWVVWVHILWTTQFSQPPLSHRVVYCWPGSESAETQQAECLINLFLYLYCRTQCSVCFPPTLQHFQRTSLSLYACCFWWLCVWGGCLWGRWECASPTGYKTPCNL
jgi:hypothetical protein